MVHAIVYRFAVRRPSPLFTDDFSIPSRRDIDGRLIGAPLFGMGWGLGGFVLHWSPLFGGAIEILTFVGMMAVGMVFFQQLQQRR